MTYDRKSAAAAARKKSKSHSARIVTSACPAPCAKPFIVASELVSNAPTPKPSSFSACGPEMEYSRVMRRKILCEFCECAIRRAEFAAHEAACEALSHERMRPR